MKRRVGLKVKEQMRRAAEVLEPLPAPKIPVVYNGEVCPKCNQRTLSPYSISVATARQCQNPSCRFVEERREERIG